MNVADVEVAELDLVKDGVENEEIELPPAENEPEITEHGADEDTQSADAPEQEEGEQTAKPPRSGKKTFQERINEITREKHEAIERATAAQAKTDLLEEENRTLKARDREVSNASLGEEERRLVKERREAFLGDDVDTAFELHDKLLAVQARKASVSVQPAQTAQILQEKAPIKDASTDIRFKEPAVSAKQWMERNPWYKDENQQQMAREAEYIERELLQQGYGVSDALYEELDRRLQQLPEFETVFQQQPNPSRDSGKAPITPPSRGGEPPKRPKPGQLTTYDKRVMRQANLDPDHPKHRAAYLKYKGK